VQRDLPNDDFTACRRIESADQMHERAFAATAWAGERHEFIPGDREGDIIERADGSVLARHVSKLDQRLGRLRHLESLVKTRAAT
jgi:hypothetical protein